MDNVAGATDYPNRITVKLIILIIRFNVLHPEKIPSAIERYKNEIHHILGILEDALKGKD